MRLLPTSWLNAPQCTMPVSSSQLPLRKTHHSRQSNALRLTTFMVNTLRKPTVHECEQSPKAPEDKTIPLQAQTLLERMGLGNQTLMARLRLPLRSSPNLTHTTCFSPSLDLKGMVHHSNEPAMMREMPGVIMHGIGTNLEVGHHGRTLMKVVSPPQRKPTFCRTPTSPISNKHCRTSSPNRAVLISLPSSGKMSLQINKSTSEHWSKTDTQGLQPMTKSLTLETILSSQQSGQANQRLKSSMTHSGTMHGRNIQLQFSGHTHIGKKNSMNTANISLANSLQVSTSPLILCLTKLPGGSFMDTKNYPLLTLINSPSSPTKSFCPENDKEAGP